MLTRPKTDRGCGGLGGGGVLVKYDLTSAAHSGTTTVLPHLVESSGSVVQSPQHVVDKSHYFPVQVCCLAETSQKSNFYSTSLVASSSEVKSYLLFKNLRLKLFRKLIQNQIF